MKKIRVLLADDHTLVRTGLRLILEQIAGVEVVAEARTGREALQMLKTTCPDIVLMDITMKDLNGSGSHCLYHAGLPSSAGDCVVHACQ